MPLRFITSFFFSSTKAISMLQYLSIGRFSEELQTLLKSQRVFVFHRINQEIKEAEQFFEVRNDTLKQSIVKAVLLNEQLPSLSTPDMAPKFVGFDDV